MYFSSKMLVLFRENYKKKHVSANIHSVNVGASPLNIKLLPLSTVPGIKGFSSEWLSSLKKEEIETDAYKNTSKYY